MINHVNKCDIFYKQRVTCEKNDVCATVSIDADFDRQIHNNNNNANMRRLNVLRLFRAAVVFNPLQVPDLAGLGYGLGFWVVFTITVSLNG